MLVKNADFRGSGSVYMGRALKPMFFHKQPIIHTSISCRWSVENPLRSIAKQITYNKPQIVHVFECLPTTSLYEALRGTKKRIKDQILL